MNKWEYFAGFNPIVETAEDPMTIVRRPLGYSGYSAQELNRYGQWHTSWLILDISMGKGVDEVEPITHAQAVDFAHGWFAKGDIAKIPDDLRFPLPEPFWSTIRRMLGGPSR